MDLIDFSKQNLLNPFFLCIGELILQDWIKLEVVFHRDRDKTIIRNIRNEVEDFEYRTKVRAEKLEKARLLQQEAEDL